MGEAKESASEQRRKDLLLYRTVLDITEDAKPMLTLQPLSLHCKLLQPPVRGLGCPRTRDEWSSSDVAQLCHFTQAAEDVLWRSPQRGKKDKITNRGRVETKSCRRKQNERPQGGSTGLQRSPSAQGCGQL